MDFIRRKYLVHVIDNNIDFLRDDAMNKVNNFTLNHVLALRYLTIKFPKAILTKDIFSNPNFFVFLHMAQSKEVFDTVFNVSFDTPTLYVKSLVRNYSLFSDAIKRYKEICQSLLLNKIFIEIVGYASTLGDIIGVNYDLSLNPLFHKDEPIRDMEIIFTKLFKKTDFRSVKKLPVLRLVLWAYLSKHDTGLSFDDNDKQDIYTIFQKTGPVIHSTLTEQFREYMFSNDRTSYWIWLKEPISNDSDIYKDKPAITMYDKLLSYIYSEVVQGRVNKNMLKLIYMFEINVNIKTILLEIIYGIPSDILGIIDAENDEWKKYFIDMYKESFINGSTFISDKTFYDDLFNVVALINPAFFKQDRIIDLFKGDTSIKQRFDDMDMNTTYFSQMIYGTTDIDLLAIESQYTCQIYNEETKYYIREYNTYMFLHESNPLIIDNGILTPLSSISDTRARLNLFSKHVLKYFLDGKLASLGLVIDDYNVDIVSKMLQHMKCIENVTCFVDYVSQRNRSIIPSIIRTIITHFNVPVIILFRSFLKANMTYVESFLDNTIHLTNNDKKYIRSIIEHGR
ncbi:IMV protein [Sea otter poxvirus]|uniref:Protein E6 homolog n=1 Tax=Sea otter poxvirus TaxID=1416741 RepID=A0A2U9QHJ6_9POXV|nr:IMV protein [Sea otter poxvirus]AWU47074.1 IMV protein [Sea otter poxvirus]